MLKSYYITRPECVALLDYSYNGFRKFVARTPDFPKSEKRSTGNMRGRVVYVREEVYAWLRKNSKIRPLRKIISGLIAANDEIYDTELNEEIPEQL